MKPQDHLDLEVLAQVHTPDGKVRCIGYEPESTVRVVCVFERDGEPPDALNLAVPPFRSVAAWRRVATMREWLEPS